MRASWGAEHGLHRALERDFAAAFEQRGASWAELGGDERVFARGDVAGGQGLQFLHLSWESACELVG